MNNQKILTAGNTLMLKYYTADSVSRQPQVDTEWESLSSLRKNMYLQTVPWTTLVQAVQEMDLELSNPSLILHTDWRFEDAEKHNCFFPLQKNICYTLTPIKNYAEAVPFKKNCLFAKKFTGNRQWNQLPSTIKSQSLQHFARSTLTSFPSWAGALGGRGRRR